MRFLGRGVSFWGVRSRWFLGILRYPSSVRVRRLEDGSVLRPPPKYIPTETW